MTLQKVSSHLDADPILIKPTHLLVPFPILASAHIMGRSTAAPHFILAEVILILVKMA